MCPRTRPFPVNLQRPLDPTDKPAAAGLDRLVHIFRLQPLRVRYHTHPRYVVCSCIDRAKKFMQHGDTESTEMRRSENKAPKPFLEGDGIKIHQQSDPMTTEPKVGQHLSFVDRQ